MAAVITTSISTGKAAARISVDTVTISGTGFAASTQLALEINGPDADRLVFVTSDPSGAFTYSYVPMMIGTPTVNAYPIRTLTRQGSVLPATANFVIDTTALAVPAVTATASGAATSG